MDAEEGDERVMTPGLAGNVVAGDLIRDNIQRKTSIGLKIKKLVEQGELVPDEIVSSLVIPKLEELNGR